VLIRLALFALAVALFARFLEAPLTRLVGRLEPAPDRLITVVSVGLIVAATAGALGFSLAIGAFFGGLAFSRDPEAVKLDAYFDPLYDFFTPFFFIAIGLRVDPEGLGTSIPLGLLLFLVAAGGKLLGAGGASLVTLRPHGAVLLGLSMIPRAEIAMVIMQYGMLLGAWAVSAELFSTMVVVSLLTCLVAPIALRAELRRGIVDPSPERP
jgi:Kef-type K+ transport system membrane component KefB